MPAIIYCIIDNCIELTGDFSADVNGCYSCIMSAHVRKKKRSLQSAEFLTKHGLLIFFSLKSKVNPCA
jgi:hypothetical protein